MASHVSVPLPHCVAPRVYIAIKVLFARIDIGIDINVSIAMSGKALGEQYNSEKYKFKIVYMNNTLQA